MTEREERFEQMLCDIQKRYAETVEKMEKLKSENKTKTAGFRELLGNKLLYQNMLSLYRLYDLTD